MRKLTVIQFEDHEQKVLKEAALTMYAAFGDETEEAIEARKKANGVAQEQAPIPRGRLEKVYNNYVFAAEQFERESQVNFWTDQLDDPGDPEDPLSAAHMSKVLAEARVGFLGTVREALKLLDRAIEASSFSVLNKREEV